MKERFDEGKILNKIGQARVVESGRHIRLRGVGLRPWGFESPPGH